MSSQIQIWLFDYLNLVFGESQEHDEFFRYLVFPETSEYYQFPIEELLSHELRFNALYFALINALGLKLSYKEQ